MGKWPSNIKVKLYLSLEVPISCCKAPPVTLLVGLGPSQHQIDSLSRLNVKPMNCGSGQCSGNARPTLEMIKATLFSEVEPGLSMTVSACMRSMPGSFSFPNFGSLLGCSDSRGLKLIPILGGSPANSIMFKA